MKALYFSEHGGFENLHYGELPEPNLKSDEVLIKVGAAALNHLDLWVLRGWPGLALEMPHIGGADVCGTISECGADVHQFQVGTRVVLCPGYLEKGPEDQWTERGEECLSPRYRIFGEGRRGGFADYVVAPAHAVHPVSNLLSDEELCSTLLVSLTAWRMFVSRARLQDGQRVLIVGAGGGLNSMCIQVAKHLGAEVIALTSSSEKMEKALMLGADHVINYRDNPSWSKDVSRLTKGLGADVVVDNVGQATITQSIYATTRGGCIVTVGNTSGARVQFDNRYLFTKQISLIGSTMGTARDFENVLELLEAGALKAVVDSTIPLRDGVAGYKKLEQGSQFGKVVLVPE